MRRVFTSERTSYLLIEKNEVRKYFPIYYPDITVSKVVDQNEKDISHEYLLDCCLCLEYIPAKFDKWTQYGDDMLLQQYSFDRISVFKALDEMGVSFTIDCSIALVGNNVKLIDVATVDFDAFWHME